MGSDRLDSLQLNQTVAAEIAFLPLRRGKSGLHRAGCQITSGRREPTASATERYRCLIDSKGEMVR